VDVGNGRVWTRHVNQIIDRVISKSIEAEMLNGGVDQEVASSDNNVTFDSVTSNYVVTDTLIRKSGRIIKPLKV